MVHHCRRWGFAISEVRPAVVALRALSARTAITKIQDRLK
jgi:hypothetical protein